MIDSCATWDTPEFRYLPGFLGPTEADRLFESLWRGLHWERREIVLYGRRVRQPRLVAWYGDPGAEYRYSGQTLHPRPWPRALATLRDRIEVSTACAFNAVLANGYRDGADSMGWHSDDEPELGPQPCIASLSLGAERVFLLRPRTPSAAGKRSSTRLLLAHGSLLLMRRESQARYQHCLPKTRRPVGPRINLTFRWVAVQETRAAAPAGASPTKR
jgi:alkylated DNA repair dioxygenase AlkB